MFCSECGKKLVDGTKFCSNCGAKVIKLAEDEAVMPKMEAEFGTEFWITPTHSLKFSYSVCQCVKIRAPFERNALIIGMEFWDYLRDNKIITFDEIYGVAFEEYTKRLETQLKLAHKTLLGYGLDDLGFDMVKERAERYIQERMGGYSLKQYFESKEAVENMVRSMQEERETTRNNRGYWSGGGFGVKNALIGSFKVGMMNMATDAVRGVGDSFADSGDRKKIEEYKAQVVKTDKPHQRLQRALRGAISDVGCYVYSELVSAGCMPEARLISFGQAGAKADNTWQQYNEGIYSKDTAIQKLCDDIVLQPYDPALTAYRYLCKIEPDSKEGLLALGEFLGIELCIENSLK